jgi:hypothetical protein
MSGKMTRTAYEELIAENLAWLDMLPPSPECSHVRMIVAASPAREYDDGVSREIRARVLREAANVIDIHHDWHDAANKLRALADEASPRK